jgi:hypothetical protein
MHPGCCVCRYVQSSWQYQVTASEGAAAALAGCRARRLAHGGPAALRKYAQGLISAHRLDDTFYVYDLGNTTRLLKVCVSAAAALPPPAQCMHLTFMPLHAPSQSCRHLACSSRPHGLCAALPRIACFIIATHQSKGPGPQLRQAALPAGLRVGALTSARMHDDHIHLWHTIMGHLPAICLRGPSVTSALRVGSSL